MARKRKLRFGGVEFSPVERKPARTALIAAVSSAATVTATLGAIGALVGSAAGLGTANTFTGTSTALAAGTATGAGSATGTLRGIVAAQGATAGGSLATSTLRGAGALAGAAAGASSTSAPIGATGRLAGPATGAGVASMNNSQTRLIIGSAAGVSTVSGVLRGTGRLASAVTCTGTGSASLKGAGRLAGVVAGASAVVATGQTNSQSASTRNANSLGMNIGGVSYFDDQIVFADLVKQSPDWGFNNGGIDPPLDANGWPTSLPGGTAGLSFKVPAAGGAYLVLFDGSGTVAFNVGTITSTAPGRIAVTLGGGNNNMWLTSTGSGGNYMRNIRLIPASMESNYADVNTGIFNPQFRERCTHFGCLRFLDYLGTNYSPITTSASRPKTTYFSQMQTGGSSLEYAIYLCNQVNADIWVTIPHRADDACIQDYATTVGTLLKPGLKAIVEYSNEVWNFGHGDEIQAMGVAYGIANGIPGQYPDEWDTRLRYQALRSKYCFERFRAALGAARVVGVLAGQMWDIRIQILCEHPINGVPAHQYCDAVALAPYFGSFWPFSGIPFGAAYFGHSSYPAIFSPYQNARAAFLAESIPQCVSYMQQDIAVQFDSVLASIKVFTNTYGKPLYGYEGGQHVTTDGEDHSNDAFQEKLHNINRDPAMKTAYLAYLTRLKADFAQFCFFKMCEGFSIWGRFGHLEFIEQATNIPKYEALLEWQLTNPVWWTGAAPAGQSASAVGAGTASATIRGTGRLVGSDVGAGTAAVVSNSSMNATAAGVSTVTGTLRGTGRLVGSAAGAGTGSIGTSVGTPISAAKWIATGHSLVEDPIQTFAKDLALNRSMSAARMQQATPGSTIKYRTLGSGSNPYITSQFDGYRFGKNSEGFNDLDMVAEMRNPTAIGTGPYTHLIIGERHDSLGSLRYEDSLKALRHYAEMFHQAQPAGLVYFYGTWQYIDPTSQSTIDSWITFTRGQQQVWECMTARLNNELATAGRADRISNLPADGALARLVELATTTNVPGITGASDTDTIFTIFENEGPGNIVHMLPVGHYFLGCVIYASIYKRSPVGNTYAPSGTSATQRTSLATIAWDYVQAYFAANPLGPQHTLSQRMAIGQSFPPIYWSFFGSAGNAASDQSAFAQTDSDNPFFSGTPSAGWWPLLP